MPKISVIMPAYNAEAYIQEAIDSILNQTFEDFELIIINDCSTDRTKELIAAYTDPRIRYVENEKNMGVAATLNRGLELASGTYIARMDSDDISMPERFEKQVAYMDTHPEIAVLGTAVRFIGVKKGNFTFSTTSEQLKVDTLFGNCLAHPSVMMRGEYFGPKKLHYEQEFNKMEDFDLWIRTADQYQMACLPEVLLEYRIHPNQVTHTVSKAAIQQLRSLKLRQLAQMGIHTVDEQVEAFLSFCQGNFQHIPEQIILLSKFFSRFRSQNAMLKLYDTNALEDTFSNVIQGQMNTLPFRDAIHIAKACGVLPIVYGTKRGIRAVLVRIQNFNRIRKNIKGLNNTNFSIISNNCWGSFVYQKYGIPYQSPTAGLYILGHDFVKLCADWQTYMVAKLEFIPWEDATYHYALINEKPYPVAKLNDIEIYFMHYHSEQEAAEKWYRRAKRINPDHILFKLSQREECSKEDIQAFMNLPLKHKLCFAYDKVPNTVYIPELKGFIGDEYPLLEDKVDEISILNRL